MVDGSGSDDAVALREPLRDDPWMSVLLELMQEHARFALPGLRRDLERFGTAWLAEAEDLVATFYPQSSLQREALRAYGRFTIDTMRRQRRFEQLGRYEARPPAGTAGALDEQRRQQDYLPGLLLSHYLWPQHYQQLCFFRESFVPRLVQARSGRLLEVGIGSGLFMRLALQALPAARGLGLDLSETALAFSRRHAARYGLSGRFEARHHDLLQAPLAEHFDALICVEVLEHLEKPESLLRALRRQVEPSACVFVSAALNAADIDHVHLYREPGAVLRQVEAAGFRVEAARLSEGRAQGPAGVPVPAVLALIMRPSEVST